MSLSDEHLPEEEGVVGRPGPEFLPEDGPGVPSPALRNNVDRQLVGIGRSRGAVFTSN